MNKKYGNSYYIVDEFGEVIDSIDDINKIVKLEYGDRVVRKNSTVYLNDVVDFDIPFIKLNNYLFRKYCRKYSILPMLINYIGYMDNICEFDNGRRINVSNLSKLCNVSKDTIYKQLDGMVKDDLIHKFKNGKSINIMINPYLCIKGKKILKSTYDEFKSSALRQELEGYREWQSIRKMI